MNYKFAVVLVLPLALLFCVGLVCPTIKAQEGTSPSPSTDQTVLSRQRLEKRLDGIVFDKVYFDHLPLGEVLKQIEHEVKWRDPQKKGINFLIQNPPEAGLPNSGAKPRLADLTVTILPELTNVTLRQLLSAITRVTPRPVQYSIEDNGVVFTEKLPPKEALHTRTFKLEAKLFEELNTGDFFENCRAVFQRECGVDIQAPGRTVSLSERLQVLMVRGTLEELDRVEKYISRRSENRAPPPIQ